LQSALMSCCVIQITPSTQLVRELSKDHIGLRALRGVPGTVNNLPKSCQSWTSRFRPIWPRLQRSRRAVTPPTKADPPRKSHQPRRPRAARHRRSKQSHVRRAIWLRTIPSCHFLGLRKVSRSVQDHQHGLGIVMHLLRRLRLRTGRPVAGTASSSSHTQPWQMGLGPSSAQQHCRSARQRC
jgi:hypothetical protein